MIDGAFQRCFVGTCACCYAVQCSGCGTVLGVKLGVEEGSTQQTLASKPCEEVSVAAPTPGMCHFPWW